jgi:hypothetical protein
MTGSQLLGIVAVIYLLDDLALWFLTLYAPPSRHSQALRRALFGLIGLIAFAGLWAFFTFQIGGPTRDIQLPGWFSALAAFGVLTVVGIRISDLKRARKTHLAQR